MAKGTDFAQQRTVELKQKAAEAAASKLTLAALLEQWQSLALALRRPSYQRKAVRAVKVAFPGYVERSAEALTREIALPALDALARAGKVAMAGRTLAYARACFTWARKRGLVPDNPFLGLPVSAGTSSRDRVLTDEEVAAVRAGALAYPFGPLCKLLLLTAQRRDEVAGLRWPEVSATSTVRTIPKERAKNGKAHLVHLAPAARAILDELPRFASVDDDGNEVVCDLAFTTNGKTPV